VFRKQRQQEICFSQTYYFRAVKSAEGYWIIIRQAKAGSKLRYCLPDYKTCKCCWIWITKN